MRSFPCQVPPLTPHTNKKVGEFLRLTYENWSANAAARSIPKDPRSWTCEQVNLWLHWSKLEFSLESRDFEEFVQSFNVSSHLIN